MEILELLALIHNLEFLLLQSVVVVEEHQLLLQDLVALAVEVGIQQRQLELEHLVKVTMVDEETQGIPLVAVVVQAVQEHLPLVEQALVLLVEMEHLHIILGHQQLI